MAGAGESLPWCRLSIFGSPRPWSVRQERLWIGAGWDVCGCVCAQVWMCVRVCLFLYGLDCVGVCLRVYASVRFCERAGVRLLMCACACCLRVCVCTCVCACREGRGGVYVRVRGCVHSCVSACARPVCVCEGEGGRGGVAKHTCVASRGPWVSASAKGDEAD